MFRMIKIGSLSDLLSILQSTINLCTYVFMQMNSKSHKFSCSAHQKQTKIPSVLNGPSQSNRYTQTLLSPCIVQQPKQQLFSGCHQKHNGIPANGFHPFVPCHGCLSVPCVCEVLQRRFHLQAPRKVQKLQIQLNLRTFRNPPLSGNVRMSNFHRN